MLKKHVTIRDAQERDIEELALLMTDLGYPTSVADMQTRFRNIAQHPDYWTVVARAGDEIVGMAGLSKGIYYEMNGMYMRILAFVVKQNSRKMGVGRMLIAASEALAVEQGLKKIIVHSGNRDERQAAHAFYQKMGYEVKSSGFVKEL